MKNGNLTMLAICTILLALLASPLFAVTLTWDGDTSLAGQQNGSGTWDTTATNRWYNGTSYVAWNNAVPADAIIGVSGTGTSAYTVTLGAPITVNSLTFGAPNAAQYILAGSGSNVLTFANNATVTFAAGANGNNSMAITAPMNVLGTVTFKHLNNRANTNDARDMDIGGAISGGAGTTMIFDNTGSYTGIIHLSGDNSGFLGNVRINSGQVRVTSANALGSTSVAANLYGGSMVIGSSGFAKPMNVHGNFTFSWWGGGSVNGALSIDSGATLSIATGGGNPVSVNSVVSGAGSLMITDKAVTIAGSGSNTFTGTTTHTNGTLTLKKTGGAIAIPGPLVIGNNANTSDVVSYGASDQIADTSLVTLNGTGTNVALLQLNGYSDTIGGLSSFAAGHGMVENNSASTASKITVNVAGSNSYTFSGIIRDAATAGQGPLSFGKLGTGTQILSGDNTYSGTTTVNGGTLTIDGSLTNGAITVTSGTLNGKGTIKFLDGNTILDSGTVNASGGMLWDLSLLSARSVTLLSYTAGSFVAPSVLDNLLAPASYAAGWRLTNVNKTVTAALPSSHWNVNANGNWSTAGNWSLGAPNGINLPADFTSTITAPRTVTVDVPVTIGQITFDNANKYTLNGTASNPITLDTLSLNAQINLISGSHLIAAPMILKKTTDVTVTPSAGTLTLSNNISEGVAGLSLNKLGAGALVLGGVNTYSGPTLVSGGTLTINGTQANADITINSGTVNGSGILTFLDGDVIDDHGTLNASGGMHWDLTPQIARSITLVDYTGGTFIAPATLDNLLTAASLAAGWHLTNAGNLVTAALPVPRWKTNANGNWSDANNWTVGVATGVGVPADFTYAITADRIVSVDVPVMVGLINFDNTNKYTLGGVAPKTITLDTLDALHQNAAITVASGSHEITAPVVMNDPIDVTVTPAGSTLTLSGNVTSSQAGLGLNKLGAGTLLLSGVNAIDGAVTVAAGMLQLSGSQAIGNADVTVNGTLDLGGSDQAMRSITVSGGSILTNGGTLRVGTGTNLGGLVGGGAVYKAGVRSLSLSANPSYTGTFNISGPVTATVANAFGDTTGSTTFDGGTWTNINTLAAGSENFNIVGAGHKTAFTCTGNTPVIAGNVSIQSGATLSIENSGGYATTFSGILSGSGNFQWWGGSSGSAQTTASFLSGSSSNALSGAFTLEQGTLALAKNSGLTAIAGPLNIGGGNTAILRLDSPNMITDTSPITMTGIHDAMILTQGNSETMGTLTLKTNGYLDMGTGASTVSFANSSGQTWNYKKALTVQNYTSGSDRLYFGNSTGSLTATQLAQIQFDNPAGFTPGVYSARQLTTGEVVPFQTPPTPPPAPTTLVDFKLVPYPQTVQPRTGTMTIAADARIVLGTPDLASLGTVLSGEIYALTGKRLQVTYGAPRNGDISLRMNPSYAGEAYSLDVQSQAVVTGGTYQSVAQGTATLLQELKTINSTTTIPQALISDSPAASYRATMIDLAREPTSLDTIKQVIELNRLYKVPYLQLHLTDDLGITLPITSVTGLSGNNGKGADDNRTIPTYTRQELVDLVAFASARGVTIVPELELAGHAGNFLKGRPDLFRTGWYHGSTLNIANPDAVTAVESILSEVANIFSTSPYIHIGCDEADFSQLGYGYVNYMDGHTDPTVTPLARSQWDSKMDQLTAQLRASGDISPTAKVTSSQEVFRDYINTLDEYLATLGKKTIVWEGFGQSGQVPMNKDIVIMSFEQTYYNPLQIVKDGFQNINASWSPMYVVAAQDPKPTYVTGAGICAATLEQIYNWNKQYYDKFYGNVTPTSGIYVPDDYTGKILGGQLTAWENTEAALFGAIRQRLAATSEKLWTPDCPWTYDDFYSRMLSTDGMLDALLASNSTQTLSAWNVDAAGTWATAGNWTPAVPTGSDSVARFLGAITAPRTVTLNAATTVGQIVFDSVNKYTIAGTSALTLSSAGGAGITVNRGSHDINTGIVLSTDTLVMVANATDSLTLGGSVSGTASLVKAGPGRLNVTSPLAYAGFTIVDEGEMDMTTFNEGANSAATVSAGATLVADRVRGTSLVVHGTVVMRANGTSASVSIFDATHTLTVGSDGKLDLKNNSLIVKAGDLAAIQGQIKTAYANGAWTGNGITTTTGAAGTGLGVDTAGHLGLTSLAGQTVAGADVLVKYTWLGDADFNGVVDFSDFLRLQAGYGKAAQTWANGDFNYDNAVDFSDFLLLQAAYGKPALSETVEPVSVPEPATLGLLTLGGLALLRRRPLRRT